MDPHYLRPTGALLTGLLLICFFAVRLQAADDLSDANIADYYDETEVKSRINSMDSEVVSPRYNTIVKSYILTYVMRNRAKAQAILGKRVMYFPLFESYLKKYNLPADLKYLAVVESALNPKAVSRAGAVGLWQFMPATAMEHGLKINGEVDERSDPHKSTEAAMRYLSFLYSKFGNWELAIAAYNSGPGRVNRAVRRGRSKNFWKIHPYLPRETRNYVPAFIAATYLIEYFDQHNLEPEYPNFDLQLTETIKVYSRLSFLDIARATDVPLDIVETLNPAFEKGFIPQNPEGHNLTLPLRAMPAFKEYLENRKPDIAGVVPLLTRPFLPTRSAMETNSHYLKTIYEVKSGENLEQIAASMNYSIHQILAWNRLTTKEVTPGQQLIVYQPKSVTPLLPKEKVAVPHALPGRQPDLVNSNTPAGDKQFVVQDGYVFYVVSRESCALDIVEEVPGITIEQILRYNLIRPKQILQPGTKVRVRKL